MVKKQIDISNYHNVTGGVLYIDVKQFNISIMIISWSKLLYITSTKSNFCGPIS